MSEFVRVLNLVKTKRSAGWLTASQAESLTLLRQELRVPGTINLSGSTGVGKTFLAWTLSQELGYAFFSHPRRFGSSEQVAVSGVIIDNCSPERQTHRDLLRVLHFRNIHYAVLITRHTIRDYTHFVELRLVASDISKVCENLASIGVYPPIPDAPNLWFLVNSYLTNPDPYSS